MDEVSWRDYVDTRFASERELWQQARTSDREAIAIALSASEKALNKAEDAQTYKDEQANKLREQIGSERNLYPTREELKPVFEFMAGQTGKTKGSDAVWAYVLAGFGILIGAVGLITHFIK